MGSPSVTTSTTGSASGCRRRCRPAIISACCRFVPCTHSGSTSASCTGVSRRAIRSKPMICSASCRNRVCTRCESASAVCFIGPQRPSMHHREREVDAERHRRRRTPLGLDAPRSRRPCSRRRDAGAAAQRVGDGAYGVDAAARRRTPTAACVPISSSADPVRWSSWSPLPAASICAKTRFSAVSPSRRTARGVSRSPSSPRETKPCRSSSRSSSRSARKSAARRRPEVLLEGVHVDVVERRARVASAPATARAPRGRRARRPPRRRRCSRAARRRRACSPARGPCPGRSARRLSESCAICEARSGSDIASLISWPSCSRCSGRQRGHHPVGRGLPAGERVDQLVDVLPGSPGRARRACP